MIIIIIRNKAEKVKSWGWRAPAWWEKGRLIWWYNRGYTAGMKTAISIPDQLFQAAESLAQRLGISRSELYSKAVNEYLENHAHQGVRESLNAVYSTEDSALDERDAELQERSIDKEAW